MVYIIQTNTVIDNEGDLRDFQSMVFKYPSWEDYKNDLLYRESTGRIIMGTMDGCMKPRASVIEEIIIDDELHLECIIKNKIVNINIKAYKVEADNFERLTYAE